MGGVHMDFIKVFKEYYVYIYSYAYKLTNSKESAEDLIQETFLKAYEKMQQLRKNDSVRFWLRSICLNTYLMKLRKLKKIKEVSYDEMLELQREGKLLNVDDSIPTAEDEIIVDETIKNIQNGCFLTMVHLLSENQRIVFSLVDMFGLNVREVSVILDITESATKALLYRARTKLDIFFSKNCSLIHIQNPCKCRAWEEFTIERERMKNSFLERKMDAENSKAKIAGSSKRNMVRKIRYLYSNMPDHKPSNDWYESVLTTLKIFIK